MNIILVGFMGTGKTTIGKVLASRLTLHHVDLDEVIVEHVGCSISTLFQEKGETYFRDLESTLLSTMLNQQDQVLTTGGGAVLRLENREAMLASGTVIGLCATEEELIRRLASDQQRPLLAGGVDERVKTLMKERAGAYDFAPVQIDTTGKSVDAIVDEILMKLVELNSFR